MAYFSWRNFRFCFRERALNNCQNLLEASIKLFDTPQTGHEYSTKQMSAMEIVGQNLRSNERGPTFCSCPIPGLGISFAHKITGFDNSVKGNIVGIDCM